MVIMTEVSISREEVHKLIKDHLRNVHKLDVDEITLKPSNNKFEGFDLKIAKIETSIEEIHEATPTFEVAKEKVII